MSIRDNIKAANAATLKTEEHTLPVSGERVLFKGLMYEEQMTAMTTSMVADKLDIAKYNLKLIAFSVCDLEGNRLYRPDVMEDLKEIGAWAPDEGVFAVEVVSRLNGQDVKKEGGEPPVPTLVALPVESASLPTFSPSGSAEA